jgi:hypothetical protein
MLYPLINFFYHLMLRDFIRKFIIFLRSLISKNYIIFQIFILIFPFNFLYISHFQFKFFLPLIYLLKHLCLLVPQIIITLFLITIFQNLIFTFKIIVFHFFHILIIFIIFHIIHFIRNI